MITRKLAPAIGVLNQAEMKSSKVGRPRLSLAKCYADRKIFEFERNKRHWPVSAAVRDSIAS